MEGIKSDVLAARDQRIIDNAVAHGRQRLMACVKAEQDILNILFN